MLFIKQKIVRYLVGFLKHRNQVSCLLVIAGREEGIGCAGRVRTAGTSDTMDVILRRVRIIKVDDVFDTVHICIEKTVLMAMKNVQHACYWLLKLSVGMKFG